MEQEPHIPPIQPADTRDWGRGGSVDALTREMNDQMRGDDLQPALAFFRRIHPVDQSEVLVELSREHRQNLLVALPAESTAATAQPDSRPPGAEPGRFDRRHDAGNERANERG